MKKEFELNEKKDDATNSAHNVKKNDIGSVFVVITMNAILGTVQHFKAEQSLDSLRELSSPSAKVIRNGIKIEIDSKNIVPGDILLLEAGDMISADGRILKSYSLKVNESSLTGESLSIDKIICISYNEYTSD